MGYLDILKHSWHDMLHPDEINRYSLTLLTTILGSIFLFFLFIWLNKRIMVYRHLEGIQCNNISTGYLEESSQSQMNSGQMNFF